MKKLLLKGCLVTLGLLCSFSGLSQVKNDFDVRYENKLKGDITLIGNNIVNRQSEGYWERQWVDWGWLGGYWRNVWVPFPEYPNDPYNATGGSSMYNDDANMQYIDIDGDPSTFSSSSANLTVPDP